MRHPRMVLVLALAASLALGACSDDDGDQPDEIAASPLTESPGSPTLEDTASPTPSATPSPLPSASPEAREATDTDRARFVDAYRPEGATDLEHVAVDLDADGTEELVFTYVSANDTTRVDVAWWDGTAYAIEYRAEGGPAQRVDRVRIADVNGDGVTEVATFQSQGSGESMTLWQVSGERSLAALRARGGCYDGQNTYGRVGVELDDRDGDGRDEIRATCDDSPLPVAAWHTEVYVWEDGAYRAQEDGTVG